MDPVDLIPLLQGPALVVVLLAGLCTIGALVGGALAIRGRDVPTPVLALPALVLFGAAVGLGAIPGAGLAPVARWVGLRSLAFWVALVPLGVLLLLLGVVGAKDRPWRPAGAVVAAIGVALTVAVTLTGGVVEKDLAFPILRAGVYGVFGVAACAALLSGGAPAGSGRRAGPAAAVAWLVLVGMGEGASQGLAFLQLLLHMTALPTPDRAAFIELARAEVVAPMASWSWAAVGAGAIVGVGGLVSSVSTTPRRGLSAVTVLLGVAVVLGGWRLATPKDDALLTAASPAPIPPSSSTP